MGVIRYEANPPKILQGSDIGELTERSMERLRRVAPKCDAIHITENVLGHERVSPITIGTRLKAEIPDTAVTVSLRVRDKTWEQIDGFVARCIESRFEGILVLMGDRTEGKQDSGQIPSTVIQRLKGQGADSKISLYAPIANEPTTLQIQKKIQAEPSGFFTQVVHTVQQVKNLSGYLYGFRLVPIIMYPSQKNAKSAEFLNISMDAYANDFEGFVDKVYEITGDVLLTSPNDFDALDRFLEGYSAA